MHNILIFLANIHITHFDYRDFELEKSITPSEQKVKKTSTKHKMLDGCITKSLPTQGNKILYFAARYSATIRAAHATYSTHGRFL